MNLSPAPKAYDQANEQSVRNAIVAADQKTRKVDVASDFVLLIDSVTGEVGKLTIAATVPVWTAL